jgi:hypothetical protein
MCFLAPAPLGPDLRQRMIDDAAPSMLRPRNGAYQAEHCAACGAGDGEKTIGILSSDDAEIFSRLYLGEGAA